MATKSKRAIHDIISIGDATLDHFVQINTASLLCNINEADCWLCLKYSEKIPIEELISTIGGNACNNAVGSARLGLKAAFFSTIGDDDVGQKILKLIKKEKVSLKYLTIQKRSASNLSIALRYKTERTILVYHQPRKYTLPVLSPSKWIYLTSLGKEFPPVHKQLLSQLKHNGASLAFNPGTHQLLAGTKALAPVLKRCQVLLVNKEEAQMLLGDHKKDPIPDLMQQLRMMGPEIVVITDGEHGAYAFDGKRQYRINAPPAHVVERTGAGDSFSTGFLAALSHGKSIDDGLVWGVTNAASVIEHVGPQAGLLTTTSLLARIKKSKCCAIEM